MGALQPPGGPAERLLLQAENSAGSGAAWPAGWKPDGVAAAGSQEAPPVAASERSSQAGQSPGSSAPSAVVQSGAAARREPGDSPDRAARRGLSRR